MAFWDKWVKSTVAKEGSYLDRYYSADEEEEIDKLKARLKTYADIIKACGKNKEELAKLNYNQNIEIEKYKAKEEAEKYKAKEEEEQEKFWNNKYPSQTIMYSGRTFPIDPSKKYEIDVRHFFCPTKPLEELAIKNKLNTGTYDERALKCLLWVRKNIKYKNDKGNFGSSEYWSLPFETLHKKAGDCDSGAILLANLMLVSGIPYWRIRLNAGDVQNPFNSEKQDGHCYVTYCRETDNQFVVLDWCYFYNNKEVSKRKLHSEEREYYSIWFSWNRDLAFGKMETMSANNVIPKHFGGVSNDNKRVANKNRKKSNNSRRNGSKLCNSRRSITNRIQNTGNGVWLFCLDADNRSNC